MPMTDKEHNDPKFKSYTSQVDKALKSFESTSDWADLISALGKLNKVFNANSKFTSIPRKTLVGKRLAQCMHPSLPSGVHLKALDTYDIIFSNMGPNELAVDIFTYSAGLFPLLSYAAMNVRPVLLRLYEKRFLPLGSSLKPAMTGVIMALLPGLENGSEYFDKTFQLLDELSCCVERCHFFSCMWETIQSSPNLRFAGLTFISLHFDKKLSLEDQVFLIGNNINLLVQSLCSCLEDQTTLVQRCVLDLLVICFPIYNCHLSKPDITRVMVCCLEVLMRRDMSLNRRLVAWLMGTDINGNSLSFSLPPINGTSVSKQSPSPPSPQQSQQELTYFNIFSKDLLIQASKIVLNEDSVVMENSKKGCLYPIKVMISLLDRPEIVSPVLNDLLIYILRSLYKECVINFKTNVQFLARQKISKEPGGLSEVSLSKTLAEEKNASVELFKTADILFGKFDPRFIWCFIGDLFEKACDSKPRIISMQELNNILFFLLDKLSTDAYQETQTEYFPSILVKMVEVMSRQLDQMSSGDLVLALNLCNKIFLKISSFFDSLPTSLSESLDCLPFKSKLKSHTLSESLEIKSSELNSQFEDKRETEDSSSGTKQSNFSSLTCSRSNLQIMNCKQTLDTFMKNFLNLFELIICKKLFSASSLPEHCINYLVKNSNKEANLVSFKSHLIHFSEGPLVLDNLEQRKLMEASCNLLQLCTPIQNSSLFSSDLDDIPGWLICLLSLSCVCFDNFWLQECGFSCLLNMADSLYVVFQEAKEEAIPEPSFDEEANLSAKKLEISLNKTMFNSFLDIIENKTCFYKLAAESTWNNLAKCLTSLSNWEVDSREDSTLLRLVELFSHLHQRAPHNWVCEEVITKPILSLNQEEKMRGFLQFIKFWNCSKEMKELQLHQFDRSIIILLDHLEKSSHIFSSMAQDWVVSSFRGQDFIFLIEPVLKILLHPDTARVSVQHIDPSKTGVIYQKPTNENIKYEPQIVAVSNEGGHIVYHIDQKNRLKFQRPKSASQFISSEEQAVLQSQNSSTQRASLILENYLANQKTRITDFTLYVNPSSNEVENENTCNNSKEEVESKNLSDEENLCFEEMQSFDEPEYLVSGEEVVGILLEDLLSSVVQQKLEDLEYSDFVRCEAPLETKPKEESVKRHIRNISMSRNVPLLKTFILMYRKKYDFHRILYGLRLLKSIFNCNRKLVVKSLMETTISNKHSTIKIIPSSSSCKLITNIVDLFIRHKQSILGHDFYACLPYDIVDSINEGTYLEMIFFLLLYYIRSYFPDSIFNLESHELVANKEVHVSCCGLLVLILNELAREVPSSIKMVHQVTDLLMKGKIQKTILFSVHSSLTSRSSEDELTQSGVYLQAFLNILISLIQLEEQLRISKSDLSNDRLPKEFDNLFQTFMSSSNLELPIGNEANFLIGQPLIYQPLFLDCLIRCLGVEKQNQHLIWIHFIQQLLPHFCKSSTQVSTLVIHKLCSHLDRLHQPILKFYKNCSQSERNLSLNLNTEYYSNLLRSLSHIYHYCICISNNSEGLNSFSASTSELQKPSFVSGLVNVLTFQALGKSRKPLSGPGIPDEVSSQKELSSSMLNLLPAITSSCHKIWTFVDSCGKLHSCHSTLMKNIEKQWLLQVKKMVLNLLNPISYDFLPSLLTSFSFLWNEFSNFTSYEEMVDYKMTDEQGLLVEIIKDLKYISLASILSALRQNFKTPFILPNHTNKCKYMTLEAGMLRILHEFLKFLSDGFLGDSLFTIVTFIREIFPPFQTANDHSSIFVLISILHYILMKAPLIEEKKELKDLHDITNKLLDSCSCIVALSLEQGNFFRRYLAVKNEAVFLVDSGKDDEGQNDQWAEFSMSSSTSSIQNLKPNLMSHSNFSLSVQALHVLADVAATLLDVVYQSDEKEKVVPLLSNILFNVFPFLRNHKITNQASYSAASRLVANLSGYQYTRRSWRKECMDLLVDPNFFLVDIKSLKSWVIIVDNLMSHDKSSFQDLLARFSLTQSSSLNLFSSRDAEMEVRRQLIKRVSFAIFCSEQDQYNKSMPEIQEKLSDSLRFSNYPSLQAEVFSCFRVLVIKMSPFYLASLWPTIITELTQVLISMEQKLISSDLEENPRNFKTTDTLVGHEDKQNMLFISACKLLDLFLALPSEELPQFQLYKWAFVSDYSRISNNEERLRSPCFLPHALKIVKLMQRKFGPESPVLRGPDRVLLISNRVRCLRDLHEFFLSICHENSDSKQGRQYINKLNSMGKSQSFPDFTRPEEEISPNPAPLQPLEFIKQNMFMDFLEKTT